ncbi:unnamed protein product [Zymoseptoria tritici ST99CH_3D1]|nr:unnamed protein product [Zymoseptoria tritici ST99CH_3D1]
MECQKLGGEILAILDKVRTKGQPTAWKTVKTTFKSEQRESEILRKVKRLEALRRQCNEQLLRFVRDKQYALASTLARIEQRQIDSTSQLLSQIVGLKSDLLDAISKKQVHDLPRILETVWNSAGSLLPQEDILASLRYDELRRRWDGIKMAETGTYDWIFADGSSSNSPVHFLQWLKHRDGLYWITGKPGCGKSTLMKHISDHPNTKAALKDWANGRDLVIGTHFFWYLGTPVQKSYEGMLRSLLHDVFEQRPALMKLTCESRWNEELRGRDTRLTAWTLSELRKCITKLATISFELNGKTSCFCFFIDGLDEYDGEHDEVVQLLQDLSGCKSVKICASSRPWQIFLESFATGINDRHTLQLHLHTIKDIEKVVHKELGPRMLSMQGGRDGLQQLITDIIDKAQGVFLWVSLVIHKELLPGLRHHDSMNMLRERLRSIPDELNDYFEQIFDRIWKDKFYRKDTARIFRTCMLARQPLPTPAIEVIIHDRPVELAISVEVDMTFDWSHQASVERVRAQINGRCQDLLSVGQPYTTEGHETGRATFYPIEFLHRSVQDFLLESSVSAKLDERAGVDFDPEATLVATYVSLIKKSDAESSDATLHWAKTMLSHASAVRDQTQTSKLIDELDRVMAILFKSGKSRHWTNCVKETAQVNSFNSTSEHGQRDLIGHLIEFGLHIQVKERLNARPSLLANKRGRPYLDYALRFHEQDRMLPRTSQHPDQRTVDLLLELGCSPNQSIITYNDRSVWHMYLAFLYDVEIHDSGIARSLIKHGALNVQRCIVSEESFKETSKYRETIRQRKELSMAQILTKVCGPAEAQVLCDAVARNSPGGWLSYLKLW